MSILVAVTALALRAEASRELGLARKAVEDGFFDYAARVLDPAPASKERSLLLGICRVNQTGRLGEAAELLEGCLAGELRTEALYWLSFARLQLAGMETDEGKGARLYEEAANGFAEASSAATDPERVYDARHLRAKALLGLDRYDEGVAELRRCLDEKRRHDVESDIVSALHRARRFREAAGAAEAFAERWPDEDELVTCLLTGGESYYLLGDWRRAEGLYRLAMDEARERAREEARYGLAWTLWKKASESKGEERTAALEEAARQFEALLASSSPVRARISSYRLAAVLHELGKHEEAIERLSGLLDLEGLGLWARSLTGKAWLGLGRFDSAQRSFEGVLNAEPPRSLLLEAHEGVADSHMREGRKNKREGVKAEAEQAFKDAFAAYVKMEKDFGGDPLARARARLGQARAAAEAGDYDSAAGILGSMAAKREIPPGMRLSELHLEEGRTYRKWALQGAENLRAARLEDASAALAKAIEIEDRQELALPALIERARVEVDFLGLEPAGGSSRLAAAVALLREALSFAGATRKLEAEARKELGSCLLLLDSPQRALEEFEEARELVSDASGMLGSARSLASLDPPEADRVYTDLLAAFPSSELTAPALFERGNLRRKMGRPLDASRDLEAVARLHPRFEKRADAWLLAAGTAREAGELGRAEQLYGECRLFVGDRADEARLKRAGTLLEMGRAEEAARLTRGLGAEGLLIEGQALERLKRWPEALASLKKAADDPGVASAASLATGRVLLRLGQFDLARGSFLSAVYLAPEERRRAVAEEAARECRKLAPRDRVAELIEHLRTASGM